MASTSLILRLFGDDKSASSALRKVGGEAKKTSGIMGKVGKVGKAAMLGVAVAALDFGKDSIAAFADAEKSQRQLEDAYKRFPKVASVNIDKLREYNQTLQRKTGTDADDIASGQAVLARYKLTGEQMQKLTPLLVDYANRTGKSIPDAAKAMGKSLGGAGRLAKELGFSFKASKDPAKNYQQILEGLQKTVGGYTDKMPEAEKKQAILAASFGDLQENVGEKLQPALLALVDAGQGVLDWLEKTPEVGEAGAAVWELLGMAMEGLGWVARKLVIPALVMMLQPIKWLAEGAANLLDALGNVPGFEWAKEAAGKLRTVATGIDKIQEAGKKLSEDPPGVDFKAEKVKEDVAKIDSEVEKLRKKRIELKAKGDTKGVEKVEQKIKQLQRRKNDIQMDAKTNGAASKLNSIDKKIKDLNRKRVELKTRGDTKGADAIAAKIARLKRQRNEIRVGVGLKRSGPQKVTFTARGGGTAVMRFAASGTPYAPSGGLTWVGEAGPELMALPTGSRIYSNGQSRALANRASSATVAGGDTYIINAPPGAPRAFALEVEDQLVKLRSSRGQGGRLRFEGK